MTKAVKLKEGDIWINEDFSNDYEEFKHKQKYVYCAQLPWVGSTEEAELMKKQILQNQELRKEIVDLADIWDGKESGKYGQQLERILRELEISDVPEFYSKENMDKLIKEIRESLATKKENGK